MTYMETRLKNLLSLARMPAWESKQFRKENLAAIGPWNSKAKQIFANSFEVKCHKPQTQTPKPRKNPNNVNAPKACIYRLLKKRMNSFRYQIGVYTAVKNAQKRPHQFILQPVLQTSFLSTFPVPVGGKKSFTKSEIKFTYHEIYFILLTTLLASNKHINVLLPALFDFLHLLSSPSCTHHEFENARN